MGAPVSRTGDPLRCPIWMGGSSWVVLLVVIEATPPPPNPAASDAAKASVNWLRQQKPIPDAAYLEIVTGNSTRQRNHIKCIACRMRFIAWSQKSRGKIRRQQKPGNFC